MRQCADRQRGNTQIALTLTHEGSVSQVYVKALYSYVHTYLLAFFFRTNLRGIPAYLDSSVQNRVENHSGIVRKI